MHVKIPRQSWFHRSSWMFRLLLIIGMLSVLLFMIPGNGKITYAASSHATYDTDPVKIAVDIARPAVVRVFTEVRGHLIVHFSTGDVTFPQGNNAYSAILSGSGTFITAHGDILTADHVVSPPAEVFADSAASDVATYMNQHGSPTTADQVVQALLSSQLASDARYDQKSSEVYLSTDYTGPLTAATLADVPPSLHAAATIEKESASNQKDVAIIHVPLNDTPNIQLGDSSTVQVQDVLTIIGFPGSGDVSNKPTNLLTSSVNQINVSSIKTTDTGAPVIQVGGNVEHGDSGGPALDSHGAVVGIVSFGLATDTPGETSFLQASNSARELVQTLNLNTTPGTFQKEWSQAFTDYSATTPGHWHKAAQELGQVATTYPLFQAVTQYLNNAQAQARTEQVSQSQTTPIATPTGNHSPSPSTTISALALTVGAVAVLLLLIILFFAVALRRRGKKSTTGFAAPKMVSPQIQASLRPQPPLPQANSIGPVPQSQVSPQPQDYSMDMAAFGAPVNAQQQTPAQGAGPQSPASRPAGPPRLPVPPPTMPAGGSGALRPWPCGHMNRASARFCSICGEPAPPAPTIRRVEQ
jgi:serine protease Do